MCGIAGLWSVAPSHDVSAVAAAMAGALVHRGPDASGVWADPGARLALGHTRLAVLDLTDAGNQPMLSAGGRHVLVYNGEVYNHLEIRGELEAEGKRSAWCGHSDTETLLAAIESWGLVAALQRAVGMFALAVWDRKERRLQLARDRAGEKPLYYGWQGRTFVFASELKALHALPGFGAEIDRDALALFMRFGAVPAPRSIYRDVFKLEPGCILQLGEGDLVGRSPRLSRVWSFAAAARQGLAQPIDHEGEALSAIEKALSQAVAAQSVADVPLGVFLSGGVDSSTVAAILQSQAAHKVQTFTIGFDELGFDEAPHAAAVARHLGTDHHELRVSPADAQAVIPKLPTLYDEPFADSSQIPTFLVCRAARGNVTVALSGDAGDELFGGYNRYFLGTRAWRKLGWLPRPLRGVLGHAMTAVPPQTWDRLSGRVSQLGDKAHKLGDGLKGASGIDDLYRSLLAIWPPCSSIVPDAGRVSAAVDDADLVLSVEEPEHRMMLWDSVTYLPDDILTKVDRAAMGVSLETRMPFLDHRVIELAWRLPLRMKIRDGQGKWALRQVLYKYVPRELIERPKAGFAIPVGEWLRGPLRDWAESLISQSRLNREGFFDPKPIRTRWQEHLSGRRDWTPSLWAVLMFQSWLERYRAT